MHFVIDRGSMVATRSRRTHFGVARCRRNAQWRINEIIHGPDGPVDDHCFCNVAAASMKSPTANVLSRLVWLGNGDNTAQGSGTLVSYGGIDYLVTAHHVYADCSGNPLVRFRAQWNGFQWEVVAKDESLDIIVLKSPQLPTDLQRRLPVLYGVPQGAIRG